jgi:DMSO reductase family type II enzyme heme b subunit
MSWRFLSSGNKTKYFIAGLTVFLVAIVTVVFSLAQTTEKAAAPAADHRPPKPSKEDLEAGKTIYFTKCVWCHGEKGDGQGFSANRLFPRPRNFNPGTFKIRQTASGELPLEEDLLLTVRNGLPGSAMPPWDGILSETEQKEVERFVRTTFVIDRKFDDPDETFTMIDYGKQVSSSKESIAKGREVFMDKAKCVQCHGNDGRGDGNLTQKDEFGDPIFPADLHKCWNFRGNRRDPYNPRNVFREVSTGLNGTPMPSFADILTPEDRWNVANFIISLCPKRPIDPLTSKPLINFVLGSYFVNGDLPTDAKDPRWNEHEPNFVGMGTQIIHKPRHFDRTIDNVWVRSLYNKKEIAFLLEWDDRTKSLGSGPPPTNIQEVPGTVAVSRVVPNVYNDAIALEFPTRWKELVPPEKPRFIFGGDPEKLTRGEKSTDITKSVDLWKWEADGTVKAFTGQGWDDLTERSESGPRIKAEGATFSNGKWSLVLKRSLTTDDDKDVQFAIGQYIPIDYFAWDGSNGETGLKMGLATWSYMILEPPLPRTAFVYPLLAGGLVVGVEFWIYTKFRNNKSNRKK